MESTIRTFRPPSKWEHRPTRVPCTFCFCLLISSLFYLTAATNTTIAATYYVDAVNGNDSNLGTSESPWKTLNRTYTWYSGAGTKVQEGDTVLFRNGDYGGFREHSNDNPVNSHHFHRTNWVTYKAATGHEPVLSSVTIVNSDHASSPLYQSGESYLVFDGFHITDGVLLQSTNYVKLLNCKVQLQPVEVSGYYEPYYYPNAAIIECTGTYTVSGVNDLTIQDCNICDGFTGVVLCGSRNTFSGNLVHHVSEDCIKVAPIIPCADVLIENNTFYDDRAYTTTMEIHGTKTGNFLKGATITGVGTTATGIADEWQSGGYLRVYPTSQRTFADDEPNLVSITDGNATITNITKVDPPHDDEFQIDSPLYDINNLIVRNNVFDAIRNEGLGHLWPVGFKIQCDGAHTVELTFQNNVIFSNYAGNIYGVKNAIINNNTILGDLQHGLCLRDWCPSGTSISQMYNNIVEELLFVSSKGYNFSIVSHGNNIFQRTIGTLGGFSVNGTELTVLSQTDFENLFVNFHAGATGVQDASLAKGSSAIDFGNPNYGPATDILGNPRVGAPDAGCYEYITSDPNSQTYSITASAGSGGTISPSGATQVNSGGSQIYTITPSTGYHIANVLVDGNSVGTVSSYTFTNVTANHTTAASFAINTYSITASAGSGGTISPSGATQVNSGSSQAYTISPSTGYHIADVLVDGSSVGAVSSHTFTNVMANHTIAASFAIATYSITASAGSGGTISPGGTTQVVSGSSQAYTISPSTGYHIADVLVDGSSVGAVSSYTFTNVMANHTIAASFAIATYSITASAGSGGTISPGGTTQVNSGSSQAYTISPSPIAGYHISGVLVDGSSVGAVSSYTFTNVTANHTIAAVFDEQDKTAPRVTNRSPDANAIQVPLNNLIILHIVDANKGVDANSVIITVDNNTVYTGNTADCSSEYGHCRRTGTKADYTFTYQSKEIFDFDQTVSVTVDATDLAGNAMSRYSYSFKTEMRSFGKNKKVNSGSDNLSKGRPATVRDSTGNIWAVWDAGPTGSRDIYIGKLTKGKDNFDSSDRLTQSTADQYNPAIAIGSDDKLYVAWQDNRRGNWDIYVLTSVSTSADGIKWSTETRVSDSNDANAINPAIVVSSLSNNAYIVWQDDSNSNQDIYIATSSNGFVTETVSQITSNSADQIEPAIAVDSDNTVYVVWTDARGTSSDIYGAASNDGHWTNVPIVSNANNQSSPAIAAESTGHILHLLWVDGTSGNRDIYYASSDGLPDSPLSGRSIIDDSNADPLAPAIITTGTTGNGLKVFACWQDERNVTGNNTDTDLYLVEVSSGSRVNLLVGDDDTRTAQSVPAMGIDGDGYPYLVWADSRNTHTDIYYAGSTFAEHNALASEDVSSSADKTTTVGTKPESISGVDDVSVIVPPGAYSCDIKITISKVKNPPKIAMERFSLPYEFGPSGAEFSEPVTITIPYDVSASGKSTSAYWYNPLTAALSQKGITDVNVIETPQGVPALSFKTTHFTQFLIGGGGGGGCSMSRNSQGNVAEFLLPYIGLTVVMVIIKRRDTRNRKACSTT